MFRKIHQPQVVGEMVAGILLGPSLLGWVAPRLSAFLFPPDSLGFLSALSQLGLLLFMFLIGLELDPKIIRGRTHSAVIVSHASIVAPFLLGTLLSLYLYPHLSNDSVTFTHFALFMGTAMSITAFPVLALLLLIVLASAWTTELLGIHALFGAFLAGAIMPKGQQFVHQITEKLNDLAVVLLLPIFFAFTGLRTSIGMVSGGEMWLFTFLIILVAVTGKFGGSSLAAHWSGMPWRESNALGILMNTRGLMELVLLNIGLDIGVLSPALFTMMVLMALITTFMTSPLLEWLYFSRLRPKPYPVPPLDPLAAAAIPEDSVLEDVLIEHLESESRLDSSSTPA